MIRMYIFILLCTGNIFCSQQQNKRSVGTKNKTSQSRKKAMQLLDENTQLLESKKSLVDRVSVLEAEIISLKARCNATEKAKEEVLEYIYFVIKNAKDRNEWYTKEEIDAKEKADGVFLAHIKSRSEQHDKFSSQTTAWVKEELNARLQFLSSNE